MMKNLTIESHLKLAHIRKMFGYHGGMGDPPPDTDILAIMVALEEFYNTQAKVKGAAT